MCIPKDRLNETSFRRKLDLIFKNILRRQNPLKLVFKECLTYDVQNPLIGSLIKKIDIGKKDIASELKKLHQILLI